MTAMAMTTLLWGAGAPAIGETPFVSTPKADFPRPMPAADKALDFWQLLREVWQPKLGTIVPTDTTKY